MHVNGAPMMQASMPGGVPAPVQMTAAVAGPGPGSLPAGNFQLESLSFCYFVEVFIFIVATARVQPII